MMQTLADHSDGTNPNEPHVEDVTGDVSVCLHSDEANSWGTTAASLVADLCADGTRLPVYWCGLYSPCMTLFLPVFIEGEIPSAQGIGGETPSPDSPWWTFHDVAQAAMSEGPEHRANIRATWKPLQEELLESAYDIAARGAEMMTDGHNSEAAKLTTEYMDLNFSRMMETARSLAGQG